MHVRDILDGRGDVAHLARAQLVLRGVAQRAVCAHLGDLELALAGHHADAVAHLHPAALEPHRGNRAAIVVVVGIEDQRLQRAVHVVLRRGDFLDHRLQHVLDAHALLGGDQRTALGVQADFVLNLLLHHLGLGAGQVDLVDDGQDLQVVLQCQIHVRQRLGLDALGGVHHQNRALAGGQRAGNLIVEVHMAGGVDQVQLVGLPVLRGVVHAHGLRFDGDAALPLQLHGIQHLIGHLAQLHRTRLFQDAVRQRGFAVVDVGDDAKIAYSALIKFGHMESSAYLFILMIQDSNVKIKSTPRFRVDFRVQICTFQPETQAVCFLPRISWSTTPRAISARPITSVSVPGMIRHRPPAMVSTRSTTFIGRTR